MALPFSNMLIRMRDKCQCQLCGYSPEIDITMVKDEELNVDHIFPKSILAFSHPYNLQVLCSNCNFDKYNYVDQIQFKMFKNAYKRSNQLWDTDKIDTIYWSLKGYYQDNYLNYQPWDEMGKILSTEFLSAIKEGCKNECSNTIREKINGIMSANERGLIHRYNRLSKDWFWRIFDSMLKDEYLDILKKTVFPKLFPPT